ncbi:MULTISPECIES: hypothetical protein [unclassified Bradyrhizobium]
MKGINHQAAYSLDGACTDMAEEYLPRLRRAGPGAHRHIAGAHLHRYAPECPWLQDNRPVSNRDQVSRIAAPALTRGNALPWSNGIGCRRSFELGTLRCPDNWALVPGRNR